jgi:hypothetical protein
MRKLALLAPLSRTACAVSPDLTAPGISGFLQVLDAERTQLEAEDSLAQSRTQRSHIADGCVQGIGRRVGGYSATACANRAIRTRLTMMQSRPPEETPEELEERLNEALDETFPASDPIAVHREDRGDDADAESKTSQGR